MRIALCMLLALGTWAATAMAQDTILKNSGLDMFGRTGNTAPLGSSSGGLFGNLLKSDRFHISNETSFSVLSGSGGSLSQGLNVTRLTYQAKMPLSMSVGLGNLFMSKGSYNGFTSRPGFFLHDLSLSYHPTSSATIHFQFQQVPGSRYNPYFTGYGYDDPFAR